MATEEVAEFLAQLAIARELLCDHRMHDYQHLGETIVGIAHRPGLSPAQRFSEVLRVIVEERLSQLQDRRTPVAFTSTLESMHRVTTRPIAVPAQWACPSGSYV